MRRRVERPVDGTGAAWMGGQASVWMPVVAGGTAGKTVGRGRRWTGRLGRPVVLAATLLMGAADAARVPTLAQTSTAPTLGGVVLELSVTPRDQNDELQGVWSPGTRAKLLDCATRCRVVVGVPLRGPLRLDRQSRYRVVLGGSFQPGRKIGVLLSFRSGVAATEVVVSP